MVEQLEGVVSLWANQIRQVLTESEQVRKEADDVGPWAELEHWKRRMVTFNRWATEKRLESRVELFILQNVLKYQLRRIIKEP